MADKMGTGEPLRVGVAGLGTVGASVISILDKRADRLDLRTGRRMRVTDVAARSRSKDRGVDLAGMNWHDDAVALAREAEIDVFVELIGGEDGPAKAAVEAALSRGLPVVTANKALLAAHGLALAKLAEEAGGALLFEAAVAGGIPAIKTLREGLRANAIELVYGVLNGTCNYILTRMENDGLAFDDVLRQAQELGYAEADPTFDVGGFDTAHKLSILASLAFGIEPDGEAVSCEGIEQVTAEDIAAAAQLGYRIKLLGIARRTKDGIEQRVHPTMVPLASSVASVAGVTNAVAMRGDAVGDVFMSGPGAGGAATASAVIADLCHVAIGAGGPAFGLPVAQLRPFRPAPAQAHEGGFYVRLLVRDRVGVFAGLAGHMADEGVSLRSLSQGEVPSEGGEARKSITLLTHDVEEGAVRRAVAAAEGDGHVVGAARIIRIESAV